MDYNTKPVSSNAKYTSTGEAVNTRTLTPEALTTVNAHIKQLRGFAEAGTISIGDAVNLAILEEVQRNRADIAVGVDVLFFYVTDVARSHYRHPR